MFRVPRLAFVLLTVVAIMLSTVHAHAGDWSDMVGLPDAHVVVVGTSAYRVDAYDDRSGDLRWSRPLPIDAPSPFLMPYKDALLVMYASDVDLSKLKEAHVDPAQHLDIVDAASGALRWSVQLRGTLVDKPLLDGDRLYFTCSTSVQNDNLRTGKHLTAVDLSSGKLLWTLDADVVAKAVSGDVYVLIAGPPETHSTGVWQVDASTGGVKWKLPGHAAGTSGAPRQAEGVAGDYDEHGVRVIFNSVCFGTLVPTDNGSNTDLNWVQIRGACHDIAFPLHQYDEIKRAADFICARSGGGTRLDVFSADNGRALWNVSPPQVAAPRSELTSTTTNGSLLYTVAVSPSTDRFTILAYDANSGVERAHVDGEGKVESPLTVLNGKIILGAQTGKRHLVLCYAADTLHALWTVATRNALGDASVTEMKTAAATDILIQWDGGFAALDSSNGQVLWTAEADVAAGPVVQDDHIIFGTGDSQLGLIDLARTAVGPRLGLIDLKNATVLPRLFNVSAWFNKKKWPNLIFVLVIVALILYFIYQARGGRELFIRRLAGLNALDEAVGRATEMGKPVLYISGNQDVDEIQTLAGLSILSHVARRAAEYETPLIMPCSRSVVLSMANEIIREAHIKAGRPDSFQTENIRYLSDDQFGFVAGVDGIMMRERPAANFYLGCFYGESLILAETGHATGAIQIAGTAEPTQLPFFVAACDYTLIGEELYAASAYLSRDPLEVGSLIGQDYAKAAVMVFIVLACAIFPYYPQIKVMLTGQ